MVDQERFVARVGRLDHPPKTRHTLRIGMDGPDNLMPPAKALLLEVEADGSAQLYRYTLDGEFGGDTWHMTRRDVEEQIEYEYGLAVGAWSSVPPGIADAHEYLLEWARRDAAEA
jgi:hypothetical protein